MSTESSIAFFVSDLHGSLERYEKLFESIRDQQPTLVLMGGDLLPSGLVSAMNDDSFVSTQLVPRLESLRARMKDRYPDFLTIPGNDDGRFEENEVVSAEVRGLLQYIPCRRTSAAGRPVYGYPFIPPSPFRLKDWERYDISQYVDPGCVAPEDGASCGEPFFTSHARVQTMQRDLERLVGDADVSGAIFLFHCPPYGSSLDRAALDGKKIDHCPLDVHIGSIAIQRFIESRQPWLTLHGHVHESARLTGSWRQRLGRTWALSAAHDGPELALVTIPLGEPAAATRTLL